MSKPVKQMMTEMYRSKFADVDGAVLIDVRGIEANDNNAMRGDLAKKQIKITVVRNLLAGKALEGTELAPVSELMQGPTALAFATDADVSVVNIARELIDWAKKLQKLEFKGAIMEGQLFTADQVTALSKYPTREEAQAQVVQIILTPAQKLAGAIVGPGSKLASIIKTIEEKLEEGEEIAKVA
jgi:large subunit ribosomal protein L10